MRILLLFAPILAPNPTDRSDTPKKRFLVPLLRSPPDPAATRRTTLLSPPPRHPPAHRHKASERECLPAIGYPPLASLPASCTSASVRAIRQRKSLAAVRKTISMAGGTSVQIHSTRSLTAFSGASEKRPSKVNDSDTLTPLRSDPRFSASTHLLSPDPSKTAPPHDHGAAVHRKNALRLRRQSAPRGNRTRITAPRTRDRFRASERMHPLDCGLAGGIRRRTRIAPCSRTEGRNTDIRNPEGASDYEALAGCTCVGTRLPLLARCESDLTLSDLLFGLAWLRNCLEQHPTVSTHFDAPSRDRRVNDDNANAAQSLKDMIRGKPIRRIRL